MRKILSALLLQCPSCDKGKMYRNRNPFNIMQLFDMYDECPNCQQDFQIEPGFYYGAMFVSYTLSAFLLFLPLGIGLIVLGSVSHTFLFTTIISLCLFYTYIFKVSRSIWLHFIVRIHKDDDK